MISLRFLMLCFTSSCNRSNDLIFGWSSKFQHQECFQWRKETIQMKKRRKIRRIAGGQLTLAFCNCQKPDLLLQTNALMVKWIVWKAWARIVRKYLSPKYNSFKCVFDLKIEESLVIQRKKTICSVLEFSFVSIF